MRRNKPRGTSLRFGLVGAGRIAQAYVQALRETPNARLTAVADIDGEAANALAGQSGCPAYSSHLDLAETGEIDAVIVATPPAAHGPISVDFLQRGIPVLCEKPVSTGLDAARLIRKTAREHNVLFTMGSKFRYVQDVVRAREIVNSGILGDVVLFENTFMSFVDMSKRWNSDRRISGGGVFIDNGTHSVDIMRYFIGPLEAIHAIEGPEIQGLPVEETVHVTARACGGAVGRMDLSWSINKQCDDYISIYGSEGTLRVGWKGSFYRQQGCAEWVQFGNGYDKTQAFREQIANFSAAIQGLEKLVIDADDAVASVEVIQAGYRALASDSWTAIQRDEAVSIPSAPAVAAA
ncbi:MAG TPA: Gfo/Idh/MocA family oxidoreductase [Bryobacteraceae bacterium]|jgi:predicted dehydrogenase|nr:Gfo/Idh/MocA family oxidoreductase [Bryobacteraceae bacterium]